MAQIDDMIANAARLAAFAQQRNVQLTPAQLTALLGATANAAALQMPGAAQEEFFAAYNATIHAIGLPNYAGFARCELVRPLLAEADVLLAFAAANGRKVDASVRNPIVATGVAVNTGVLTVDDEQQLRQAYEGLTVALAPVTVQTLAASETVLPGWSRAIFDFRSWSFGRFLNVAVFLVVLVVTCVTLSYYAEGTFGLSRYQELSKTLAEADKDLTAKASAKAGAALALAAAEKKPTEAAALAAAQKAAAEADAALNLARAAQKQAADEQEAIPARLSVWAARPCGQSATWIQQYFLCSEAQKAPLAAGSKATAADKLDAARAVAARLSGVYLLLMMGWLGAHAYILRSMSKAISERSFAPNAGFGHIVRVGMGALAGIASSWLLKPGEVGGAQWANLPVWALAFVAGYSTELVFAFMDRILGAFLDKKT